MSEDIHDANARDLMRGDGLSEWDIAEALRAAARRAQIDEREACAQEMERREKIVANTEDTKAAYRNAARAIRNRT